jgi:hypothetical protein
MKPILAPAMFLFFLSAAPALAGNAAPSYVELQDAPTVIIDWSKGNTQAVTLHGDRTLVFTNGQKGGKYLLILTQDAAGSRLVSWPSTVQWPGHGAHPPPPNLTAMANKKDFVGFFYDGERYDAISLSQSF